jgi:hypothetical protein
VISRWVGASALAWAFGVGAAAIACTRDDTRREAPAETTRAAPGSTAPAATTGAQSLGFDPATVKVGDTLGGLRVARVDVARGADDMGYVGDVRFDGAATISGERMTHPDYPEVKEICMSVDSASARRLPRFPADTRRVWLCFENRDEAARQLGPAGTRGAMTVVIDGYQTVRHFSDTYDTAILRRVVADRREP